MLTRKFSNFKNYFKRKDPKHFELNDESLIKNEVEYQGGFSDIPINNNFVKYT